MSFEQLLDKINGAATLAKALPADDGKTGQTTKPEIPAKPGNGNTDPDTDPDNDQDDDGNDNGGDGKPLTKSFTLKLDDGSDLEAFDGTDLIKSLNTRVATAEAALKQNEDQVLKSLNAAVDLISGQSVQLKEQGELIKSLQNRVGELAKTGRGRTSILTVAEKPQLETVSKAQTVIGGEDLITKALGAMKAGRITGLEASGVENRVRMGMTVAPDLIARICT